MDTEVGEEGLIGEKKSVEADTEAQWLLSQPEQGTNLLGSQNGLKQTAGREKETQRSKQETRG